MGDLLVRDVDDDLVRRPGKRAARHGRSVEADHTAIPATTLLADPSPRGRYAAFGARATRLRAESAGRHSTDSAEMIRAERDRQHSRRWRCERHRSNP